MVEVTQADRDNLLPHQCEFICQACGKRARGGYAGGNWHKPRVWYERSDKDGVQTACSRECIKVVAGKTGKSDVVLFF